MNTGIVKLKIDDSDPAFAKRLWIVFFILGSLIYTAAIFVPQYLKIQGNNTISCPTKVYEKLGLQCNRFDIETYPIFYLYKSDVTSLNQFLVVEGMPMQPSYMNAKTTATITVDVSVIGVDEKVEPQDVVVRNKEIELTHDCMHPKNGYCDALILSEIPNLQSPGYVIVVKFLNYQQFKDNQVGEYAVAFFFANPISSIFLLVFRYLLTIISIISYTRYVRRLKNMNQNNVAPEQHQLSKLGLLLIFANDPLYYVTLLIRFPIAAYAAQVAIIGFVAYLFYFWINMLERISNHRNLKSTIKGAASCFIFLFGLTAGAAYWKSTYDTLENPLSYWDSNEGAMFGLVKMVMYCVNIVGAFWLLWRGLTLFMRRETLPERDSSFLLFSTFFMVCYVIFVMTGSLQVYNDNLIRQTLFFGLTNLYLGFMLHLFTPPKGDEIELVQLGKADESAVDNPDNTGADDEKGKE